MGKTSKVVICGMKEVGKTAILEQLIYGHITPETKLHSTIEDIYVANVETERGTRERLCFYDTSGVTMPTGEVSTPNSGLQKHYISFADGYVLVYDVRKPDSLNMIMFLHKEIEKNKDKKDATIIVLGNITGKPDPDLRENPLTKAANWCTRERLKHFEVNAMERTSLYEAFVHLSTRLNPTPVKSTFPQLPALTKLTQKSGKDT